MNVADRSHSNPERNKRVTLPRWGLWFGEDGCIFRERQHSGRQSPATSRFLETSCFTVTPPLQTVLGVVHTTHTKTMSWNYRLVRTQYPESASGSLIGIHEVYYDADGRPIMVTTDPITVIGDTPEEVRQVYDMMAEAFLMPILNAEEIPNVFPVAEDTLSMNTQTPEQTQW